MSLFGGCFDRVIFQGGGLWVGCIVVLGVGVYLRDWREDFLGPVASFFSSGLSLLVRF